MMQLPQVILDYNKKYGNKIALLKDAKALHMKRLFSGSFGLDLVLGGGWAFKRIQLLFGGKSAGKNSLLYQTTAYNQRICRHCHSVLPEYWEQPDRWSDVLRFVLGMDVCRCRNPEHRVFMFLDYEKSFSIEEARTVLVKHYYDKTTGEEINENDYNEFNVQLSELTEKEKISERDRKKIEEIEAFLENIEIKTSEIEQLNTSDYIRLCGVDDSKIIVTAPETLEEGINIITPSKGKGGDYLGLIKSKEIDAIIWDSLQAAIPEHVNDREGQDATMGTEAKQNGILMRKIAAAYSPADITDPKEAYLPPVFLIAQIRCLPLDTLVNCNGSITNISKINVGDSILSNYNSFNKVVNVLPTGIVKGKRIFARNRGYFDISNNHQQPIIRNGEYTQKLGEEILEGDWILSPIINPETLYNNTNPIDLSEFIDSIVVPEHSKIMQVPKYLDEDLAFFMGCYYSDGSLMEYPEKSTYGVQFGERSVERFNLIRDASVKLFGINDVKICNESIRIFGKYIFEYLKSIGLKRFGKYKDVPELIMRSNKQVMSAFIRGAFFDTHGFAEDGFIFTNENEKSTLEIAHILNFLGIHADIRKDRSTFFSRLFLTGIDAVKFRDLIGFSENTKIQKSSKFIYDNTSKGKYDVVPKELAEKAINIIKMLCDLDGIHNIYVAQRDNLARGRNAGKFGFINLLQKVKAWEYEDLGDIYDLCLNNRFSIVDKIEDVSFDAIDIEVDGDNLFIANGILTHNSSIGGFFPKADSYSGGKAVEHFISTAIEVKRGDYINTEGQPVKDKNKNILCGQQVHIRADKNKLSTPHATCTYNYYYKQTDNFPVGLIDYHDEIITIACDHGIINKGGGGNYSYKDIKVRGKVELVSLLKQDPNFIQNIYSDIKNLM
jgi:RecA/RadA recombinase